MLLYFRQTREIVEVLSRPSSESKELTFAAKYAQPFCAQYIACLWKQNLSYWRNPQYTAVRFFYTVIISLMFGTICWKFGSRRYVHGLFCEITYTQFLNWQPELSTILFLCNCQGDPTWHIQCHGCHVRSSAVHRNYQRDFSSACDLHWKIRIIQRASCWDVFSIAFCIFSGNFRQNYLTCLGLRICCYSSYHIWCSYCGLTIALWQVTVEFPYILVQSLIYGTIFYSLGSFEWTAAKFLWYLFFMYFTLLYFTFYGMMTTAITPNHLVAPIIAAPFYTLWNLFCGFMIPRKVWDKLAPP